MSREPHDGEYAAGRSQVPDRLKSAEPFELAVIAPSDFVDFLGVCDRLVPRWIYEFAIQQDERGMVTSVGATSPREFELRGAAKAYALLRHRIAPYSMHCRGEVH